METLNHVNGNNTKMNPFELADNLRPEKVLFVQTPAIGLKAIVVVDNTACGPAVGGCRMAIDVSLDECARLARAMTLKNASAGLPHGGAKSVIFADPTMDTDKKQTLMRAFAHAIEDTKDYIVGPDMGTNEHYMACIHNEIHRAVGLPREIGGIPLDEIGATGLGVCAAAKAAEAFSGVKLNGATFAIQGFGAVGFHAARFLEKHGAIMVSACDSKATVYKNSGISSEALYAHKKRHGTVAGIDDCQTQSRDAIIDVACDIWIPAARPDIITLENVNRLNTKLIVQGANIPIQVEAEEQLHDKGVVSIPDYIANAGGVICAAVEYRNGSESEATRLIEEKVASNTRKVLTRAVDNNCTPRSAADEIAVECVTNAEKSARFK